MTVSNRKTADNTAAIAAQFGISIKALRLYERQGLLVPPRSEAGWRVYGIAELERLHAILSLKQLGLPLARIGELLAGKQADLEALLGLQEKVLEDRRAEAERALDLVRMTRTRISKGQRISPDELATLVRRMSMTTFKKTAEVDALMKKAFTPEQIAHMQNADPNDMAKTTEGFCGHRCDATRWRPSYRRRGSISHARLWCSYRFTQKATPKCGTARPIFGRVPWLICKSPRRFR